MFDEFKDLHKTEETLEESASTKEQYPNNTVDLFPALADWRMMPINAIRQAVPVRQGTQISVFTPVSFEEALDIVECLRARAATTVSLDNMKKHDAARLVDFVAGASSALQGNFHKLSERVYVFSPSNIKITIPVKIGGKPILGSSIPTLDFLYPQDSQQNKSWLSSSQTAN